MKFDWKKLHVDDADVEFGHQVDALNKLLQEQYREEVQAPMRAARRNDDARNMAYSQSASNDLTVPRVLPQITERKAPNIPATVLRQLLPGGQTNGMLEAAGEIVGPAIDLWGSKKPFTEKLGRTVAELVQWAPSKVVQMAVLGGMPMEAQAGLLSKPSLVEYLLSRPSAIFTNRLPQIRDTGLVYNTHHPRAVSEMSQPDVRRRFEREVLDIAPDKLWSERPVSGAVVDRSVWGDTGYPVYPFAGYGKQALVTQPLGKMPQARVSIGDSLNNWEEGFMGAVRPVKVSDLTEKYLRDGLAAKDLTPTISGLQGLLHGTGPGEYLEVLHPTPAAAMNATRAFVDPTGQVQKLRDLINLRMNKSDRNDELIRALGLKAGGRVKFDRGGIVKKFLSRMPEYFEGAANKPAPVGALSVVKNKGGNWLRGSVEDALGSLKQYGHVGELVDGKPTTSEVMNQWIEGPLTKYVKTRMASPDDEVRKLAEQGVLHFDPPVNMTGMRSSRASTMRNHAGIDGKELGSSPLAQRWEDISDAAVLPGTYESHLPFDPKSLEQLRSKLREIGGDYALQNPEARAYAFDRGARSGNLGFPHLIDELSNALNPTSGLPRNLQLTPEAMQQLSMEKAVRRVADINAWRETQKAAANAELANKAAVLREYPHSEAMPNPKGLRWVELKAGDLPEGWKAAEKAGNTNYPYQDPEGIWRTAQEAPHVKTLADQLKYEGDTMGHCVGGYCDDVLAGRSRIFSLRDAKGEPHVTIEARPPTMSKNFDPDGDTLSELINGLPEDKFAEFKRDILDKVPRAMDLDDAAALQAKLALGHRVFGPMYKARLEGPPSIVQIKGKGNRKPNDEYLPFVQDFVRNNPLGKAWSDVGDLNNTGLTLHSSGKYITDAEAEALAKRHFGGVRMGNKPDDIENPWQYAARIKRYDLDMLSDTDKAFLADWEAGNFASGGQVKTSNVQPKQNEVYEGSLRKPQPKQPVRDVLRGITPPPKPADKPDPAALGIRAELLDQLYAVL